MLDELVKSIVKESVRQTLQELGALDKGKQNIPETMTVKQAAEYLGMSTQWMYEHTKDLPHEKRGRKTIFNKSELDDWRKEQKAVKEELKQQIIHVNPANGKRGFYKVV